MAGKSVIWSAMRTIIVNPWHPSKMKTGTTVATEKWRGNPPFFWPAPLFSFKPGQRRKREKRNPTGSFWKNQAKPTAPLNTRNFGKVTCGKKVKLSRATSWWNRCFQCFQIAGNNLTYTLWHYLFSSVAAFGKNFIINRGRPHNLKRYGTLLSNVCRSNGFDLLRRLLPEHATVQSRKTGIRMERVPQNDQITWDRGNPAPFFILAEASKRTSQRTSKRLLLKIYSKDNLMKISCH